jgi:hypothetical protein
MRNVCAICKTREAAKDRERASPKREDSPEECGKLGKKQKVVPRGVGTSVNWLLPVSVTGCKLQLKDPTVTI